MAIQEAFTLDGLALHSSPYRVLEFEHKPAKKMLEWVRNADSDGAKLLREPRHETAEITLRIRVDKQTTKDLAMGYVGAIVDKLQEAERQSAGGRGRGLALVWTPADGTFTGTFYVLSGEVNVVKDFQYLVRAPVVEVTLTCSPFLYGAEVTTSTTTTALPLLEKTVEDVPGDVPAEARLIVTDAAAQSRDYVAVGWQNYYYDAATALLTDSANFVTSGFAGAQTTRANAYSASGVVRATLSTTPVVVCSSGELTHKGAFRNFFRLWPSAGDNVQVRLAWRQGRDQWTVNPWVSMPTSGVFVEVDVGECKIRPALLGTQSWQWRLEAKAANAGATVDADYHALVPSGEGFGKARRVPTYATPSSFTARDEFIQTPGALTGLAAPVGGTWTALASSDSDDFSVDATGLLRNSVGDASNLLGRYLTAGTTTYTDSAPTLDVKIPGSVSIGGGVLARTTDINNWLRAVLTWSGTGDRMSVVVAKRLAGTVTTLATAEVPNVSKLGGAFATVRLVVTGSKWEAWAGDAQSTPALVATGTDTDLASGTLSSGRVGIYDYSTSGVVVRRYDNWASFAPVADAACFASQSIEFRSYGDDPVLREDSSGTYWGRPPEARGGRLWLPCAGSADRTTRVAVLARRNDIEEHNAEYVVDSTSVAVAYKPRWVAIPRQA